MHSCIKLMFDFKAFHLLPSPFLSFLTTEPLIPASNHSVKPSTITKISDFPTNLFMLSFILPFLLLVLLSCILFSVSELTEMASEKYALAFSTLPYVPSTLISVKMESSSDTISFLLCVDTVPSAIQSCSCAKYGLWYYNM